MVRQEAADSRPNSLGIALGVFVLWGLLILGGQKVLFPNASNLDDLVKTQVNIIFVIAIVLLLGVTFFFRWQRRAGLKPVEPPSSWLVLWPQALSGLWFQALRLRARSIYPAMVIHGLWDFAVFIFTQAWAQTPATTEAAAAGPGAFIPLLIPALPLVLMLYGLWLLRGIGKQSKDEVLA